MTSTVEQQQASIPGMLPAGSDKLAVPHFSVAERERRWARVRDLIQRDNLDVLVVPSHTGSWDQLQVTPWW